MIEGGGEEKFKCMRGNVRAAAPTTMFSRKLAIACNTENGSMRIVNERQKENKKKTERQKKLIASRQTTGTPR